MKKAFTQPDAQARVQATREISIGATPHGSRVVSVGLEIAQA
jgi:hypothetical protein